MRVYKKQNVYDAAVERIERLFDEFDTVCVSWSGGKDSTVALHMTLEVAERRGRLPIPVLFVDQEAEWSCVIDLARKVMADPRVKPYWLQVPIKLFNATSHDDPWLMCWEPGHKWMREREDISLKENIYGTDRFHAMFTEFFKVTFEGSVANIGGVRAEETPTRTVALTSDATYRDITWGKKLDPKTDKYTFYPLYDWSYTDIWKAIHDHGWEYCKLYDYQYQYGVPTQNMRVSNLHHETAIKNLYYLQEVERDTWDRLQQRLAGISATGHLKDDGMTVKDLPPMFESWQEYRDYLLDKLISDPDHHAIFAKTFAKNDEEFAPLNDNAKEKLGRTEVATLLANDWELTKMNNLYNRTNQPFFGLRRWRKGKRLLPQYLAELKKYYPDVEEKEPINDAA